MSHWLDILEDNSTKNTIHDYIFKNEDVPDLKNIYIYKWEIKRDEFEFMEIVIHFYFPIPKNVNKKVSEKKNVISGNFTLYPIENYNYNYNNLIILENKLEVFHIELENIPENKIRILISSNYGNTFKAIARGVSLLNFGYSLVDSEFFKKLPSNYYHINK